MAAPPPIADDGAGDPSPLREILLLQGALARLSFPLSVPGSEAARTAREEVLAQLRDYVIPRYREIGAPLLAVVGGSTGAGKSSLVNALVGEVVSRSGAIRPTTRDPVLVHHPTDAAWFAGTRILPGLARVHGTPGAATDAVGGLALVASPAIGPGLALLDAPDVDSVVDANRRLAGQLLAAADLWVFVTSAHRYADAVPWALLRDAAARDAHVAVVLDRVGADVLDEIRPDLRAMLDREGLGGAPLLTVLETEHTAGDVLPAAAVADVKAWLDDLAGDATARAAVVRRTLSGAVGALTHRVTGLATAADAQVAGHARLREHVDIPYAGAVEAVVSATADGSMLRGEVLARWQEFVGTGELLRGLQGRVGALRDRVSAFVTGRPQPATGVQVAIEQGVAALVISEAERAAEAAQEALLTDPAGRALVAGRDLARLPAEVETEAAAQIRAWQDALLELVRTEGQAKRTTARLLAFGVNGVGVALMIVAFASTGGLVGAEIGIAGGTAVVGQKLLEAVFGDQAVRRLAQAARDDLRARCERLLAAERERFARALGEPPVDAQAGARLRALARAAQAAADAAGRREG